ncbi:hypothetical protein O3P69_002470 [Scylla paramamosain]|uniref:Neurotransmitter-gated ion-channel ligand-binding domain-containing protein n=1 Tax=Scylla paramamosain TaxID=85552 RepID=A0AAW0UKN8_SCYPA
MVEEEEEEEEEEMKIVMIAEMEIEMKEDEEIQKIVVVEKVEKEEEEEDEKMKIVLVVVEVKEEEEVKMVEEEEDEEIVMVHGVAVRGDEAEYRLTRYLMSNYDKSVRPSLKATMALNITFGLALTQIIDVLEFLMWREHFCGQLRRKVENSSRLFVLINTAGTRVSVKELATRVLSPAPPVATTVYRPRG